MSGHDWSGSKNPKWNGGKAIHSDGRLMIRSLDHPNVNSQGYIFNSTLIAEKTLGRILPLKTKIHHVAEITDDKSIVICEDHGYHMLLHARKRIVDAGGNPQNQKICCQCKSLKFHSEFSRCKSHWDGLQANCKECQGRDYEG